jgi:hypothetical protein
MAAVTNIPESASAGQAMLGSLVLLIPIVACTLAVRFRKRAGELQQASFEDVLRRHVLERGGQVIEPPNKS